jgi:hypothetical protein
MNRGVRPGGFASALAATSCVVAVAGCAGRVDTLVSDVPDAAVAPETLEAAAIEDASDATAAFQGDADQCATVVCSGAQVCCVVSIPSDPPTPYPNNKCDYDCEARCMDACPDLGGAGEGGATLPSTAHGGPLASQPADGAIE